MTESPTGRTPASPNSVPDVIELTDTEWMNLIDAERDGLPRCCANVSELRDVLIEIARNGGEAGPFPASRLLRTMTWYLSGHDYISAELSKVLTLCGWDAAELTAAVHDAERIEFGGGRGERASQMCAAQVRTALRFIAEAEERGEGFHARVALYLGLPADDASIEQVKQLGGVAEE